MFLLKPKPKSEEILPPPPPFEEDELYRRLEETPKFFDKILKSKTNVETFPEEGELSELLEDLDKESKSKKTQIKQIKEKKTQKGKKIIEKPKIETDDFDIDDIEFDAPTKLEKTSKKEVLLPDTLKEFSIGFVGTDFEQETKTKPKELQEAEDEIKSAIEKIKGKQKIGMFRKLFGKKEKIDKEPEEAHLIPEFSEGNEVSIIRSNINRTREALMKFDLETAKKNYIEIMKLYNKINPEEKAKVYNDIKELYSERKSAEELKA